MRRIVWGRASSSNVMKVVWTLDELGLPFERIDVGGAFGKTDTAEYRAMNPTGLVPTLQEDDFTLWESNAICRYLCQAYAPGNPIWPQDARARGGADRWMDAQQTVLGPPMTAVFWGLVRTPPEKRDMAVITKGIQDAARAYGLIAAKLQHAPYVAGETFTLADIPWGVHVHRWFNIDFDRPEIPGLRAWYDRLCERPAYQTHVAGLPVV
ncbi:MAG: glutathione S-transferase family protein [Rhodospirillales bacterium]|nr:glutathione S-transferase family protein [Rhodospirillales bacterium]